MGFLKNMGNELKRHGDVSSAYKSKPVIMSEGGVLAQEAGVDRFKWRAGTDQTDRGGVKRQRGN